MKTQLLFIIILIAALMLSACSAEDLAGLDRAGFPQSQTDGAGQSGQSGQAGEASAKGPIAPLIDQGGGNVNSPGYPPADSGGGNISSSGEQGAVAPGGDQPGMLPSGSGEAELGDSGQSAPAKWLNYEDKAFKFSIQYPDSYVILPEVEPLSENISSGLVHQVRFQERDLASGDTAAFEPPQFTVEVFTAPGQTNLEAFAKSDLPFPNMTIEPYTYGKLSGLRASTNRMLAPNTFYFFAGNGMVYKLTPLGQYSTEMLQSFTILQ